MNCLNSRWIAQVISCIVLLVFCLALPRVAAAQVHHYYISPIGSDSDLGTEAGPWRTIAHADAALSLGTSSGSTIVCGETNVGACVHVASGTYAGWITTNKSGTATQRIVYISDTRWAAKITDGKSSFSEGGVWTANGSYTTINGFDISGLNTSTALGFWGSFNHAIFNHVHDIGSCDTPPNYCTVPNGGAGIATVSIFGGNVSTDDVIDSNVIHEIGPYANCQVCVASGSNGCNGVHGIYYEGPRIRVTNNIIYHAEVDGIVGYHDPTTDVLANNVAFRNGCQAHGGGIHVAGSSSGFGPNQSTAVINNIAYDNGGWGFNCAGMSSDSILENNDSFRNLANNDYTHCTGPTQSGNLSATPGFVTYNADPATPTISGGQVVWSNADYHVTSGALGGGTMNCASGGVTPCAPSKDFDGIARANSPSIGVYTFGTGASVLSAPTGLVAAVK